jgi:hypothetical protein
VNRRFPIAVFGAITGLAVASSCRHADAPLASGGTNGEPREVVLGEHSHSQPGIVRTLASVDFGCPPESVDVEWLWRLRLSPADEEDFLLAHACHHDARYACMQGEREYHCVREPLDRP